MASSSAYKYTVNKHSASAAAAAAGDGTTASSITIEPRSSGTAISTMQPRHYCIALTNNPRMLRGQAQALQDIAAARAAAPTTTTGTTAPTRQRATSETNQQASLPPTSSALRRQPQVQPQQSVLESRSRVRPLRARSQNRSAQQPQVVPVTTQPTQGLTAVIEGYAYEREIEEDFKAQIQPILQMYLNKTKRSPPVNAFLDMSSMIQF